MHDLILNVSLCMPCMVFLHIQLKVGISKDKFNELDQAAELIMQLDPQYYYIVLNENESLDQSAGIYDYNVITISTKYEKA